MVCENRDNPQGISSVIGYCVLIITKNYNLKKAMTEFKPLIPPPPPSSYEWVYG
jgi:hypothetical protein